MLNAFELASEGSVDHMDDIVEIVENSQSVLLPEILSHIFAYLPLTDRKTVRLTCRSWYDCSLRPNVIKSEKYVFRTHFISVKEIAKLMLRSNHSLLNLEFQGVRVKELPVDVWKVCGERIQTLEFYECQLNRRTFKNVILYCTNLRSIVIKSETSRQEPTCALNKILCSSNRLDDLITKGLRRSTLRSFATLDNCVQLSESVVNKFSLLFPGIKHFSTGFASFEIPFVICPTLYLIKPPVSWRLDQCFSPETRLESLTLNLSMDGNWIETLVQEAEQGTRLKKLETRLIYRGRMKDSLFDFFKSQRNLQVLKLGIIAEASDDENKKLFFHILDNCPNLQELSFGTVPRRIPLKPSELPRFITSISKLKFFSAVFDVDHGTPASLYHDLLAKPAQLNLTSLRWDSAENDDFFIAFLQRCPSLLHLSFGGVCRDTTLQIIFQFLVELRTLVLYDISSSCSDYGFTGRGVDGRQKGYSIKRLQHLKYLKLGAARAVLTGDSTLALQLPHLEFLSLSGNWLAKLRTKEALVHFASHLPELRVLCTDESDFPMMVRVCLPLKNLYRLVCFGKSFGCEERPLAEDIFVNCPRLRYIYFCATDAFFHNSSIGKVLQSDPRCLKFPGNVFEL